MADIFEDAFDLTSRKLRLDENITGGETVIVTGEPSKFAHFLMSTNQIANLAAGDHLKFDSTAFNNTNGVTLDDSSPYQSAAGFASVGRITLKAGSVYTIQAHSASGFGSATGFVSMQISDVTTTTDDIGSGAYYKSNTSLQAQAVGGPSVATIEPLVDSIIEVRLVSVNQLNSVSAVLGGALGTTWITVVESEPALGKTLLDVDFEVNPLVIGSPLIVDLPLGYNRFEFYAGDLGASTYNNSNLLTLQYGLGAPGVWISSGYYQYRALVGNNIMANMPSLWLSRPIRLLNGAAQGQTWHAAMLNATLTLSDKTATLMNYEQHVTSAAYETNMLSSNTPITLRPQAIRLQMNVSNLIKGYMRIVAYRD